MNKNPLPSHRFLLFNRLTNWLAAIFVIILLLTIMSLWAVRYSLQRDCNNYYRREMGVPGYWIHIQIGATKDGCYNPNDDR